MVAMGKPLYREGLVSRWLLLRAVWGQLVYLWVGADEDIVFDAVDVNLSGDPIDLLLVDGPPAYVDGYGLARYPALPVLAHRLGAGATVILDDVERRGEQQILRHWERETGLRFDRQADRAGIAIARVGGDGTPGGPPHG